RGAGVQTTTYRDYEISYIDGNAATGEAGVAIVAAGDAVAVAFTPGQLEPIIDRADGIGESIVEIDGFDAALAPLPDERVIVGVLNGPKLADDGRELDVIGPALEAFIPGGPDAVTAFTVSSETDGVRIDTRTVGADGRAVRTFGDHLDSNLIGNLPAETQVAISGSDLAGTRLLDGVLAIAFNLIFGAVSDVFVSLDEPAAATPEPLPTDFESVVDQAFALAQSFVGIDLRGDLVELIDGEFLIGVWNAGGTAAGSTIGFVSESSDPQTLSQSVQSLTFIAGFLFGAAAATNAAGISEVQIGSGNLELDVVNDQLVIGYGGGGTVLTSEPESALVDSERFQTVVSPLPTERSLLIYVDIASIQAGPPATPRTGAFGVGASPVTGPALAFAFFNDGDEMGGQGYLYIPEP
ncbi:MAG: DUF3352 domain-containing protein, partial [Thermomicrobiales bacterium]|nr:DUF3352 domain-containing protein [Thermomicrobiales bacterium]